MIVYCPLTANMEENAEFISVILVTSRTRGDRLLFKYRFESDNENAVALRTPRIPVKFPFDTKYERMEENAELISVIFVTPEKEEIDYCLNIHSSQTMRMQLHYGFKILSTCPLIANMKEWKKMQNSFQSVIFFTSGTRGDRLLLKYQFKILSSCPFDRKY